MLASDRRNGELKDENENLFGLVLRLYNAITGSKFVERIAERRKAELAAQSKASFAKAVKLDGQLKQM